MNVKRIKIEEILRGIWLISANKEKPLNLFVNNQVNSHSNSTHTWTQLKSSLRQIIVTQDCLLDRMNLLLDLFCFMIWHSFRFSIWSSNMLKLVHSLMFDFLNFKTLSTLTHWSKFLSLTLFTKIHSSVSCRWCVIWHFSEQSFKPQVFRQSINGNRNKLFKGMSMYREFLDNTDFEESKIPC